MEIKLSEIFYKRYLTVEIDNKTFEFTLLYEENCPDVEIIDWEIPNEYSNKILNLIEIVKGNCSNKENKFNCNEQQIISDFKRILMPELDKKLLNKKALIAMFNDIYTENGGGDVLLLTKENYKQRGFTLEEFNKLLQAKKGEEIKIDNYRFVVLDILD